MNRVGAYLYDRLEEVAKEYDCIKAHRGVGLMQGLVFEQPVGDIIKRAMDLGLILINAGANIIRFVPSLVITEEDVDQMISILKEAIGK